MSYVIKLILAVAVYVAAYIAQAVTNSVYISSLTEGKVERPSLLATFMIPYATTLIACLMAITISSVVYTGGSDLEYNIAFAGAAALISALTITTYVGSDSFFMYQEDGYRGNAVAYKLVLLNSLLIILQV